MSVGAQLICLSSWTAGSREEMEICQSEALDSEEVALKVQRMLFFGFCCAAATINGFTLINLWIGHHNVWNSKL